MTESELAQRNGIGSETWVERESGHDRLHNTKGAVAILYRLMKTILMIGGNTGIGYEAAKKLKSAGHRVIAAVREAAPLEALGVETQPFEATALSELDLPEVLDGLVYFPGSINLKPFHRLTASDFENDYAINAQGAVHCLQQALPALKKSPQASVVLFSSVAVQTGMPFHASIAMAKGAVEGLTRSLAAELAPRIRVNAIAPSLTDTPLAAPLLNAEAKREASAKRHPLNQVGDPADLASLVSLLLGEESKFITGQVLAADGGMSSVKLF